MKYLLVVMTFLCPMLVQAEEKLTHISQETPQMIHFRSLMIDGCLNRMKYKLMYDDLDDETILQIINEIDYIWYQLGINPFKTTEDLPPCRHKK